MQKKINIQYYIFDEKKNQEKKFEEIEYDCKSRIQRDFFCFQDKSYGWHAIGL